MTDKTKGKIAFSVILLVAAIGIGLCVYGMRLGAQARASEKEQLLQRIEHLENYHTLPDKHYACNKVEDYPVAFECFFEVWDWECRDNWPNQELIMGPCLTDEGHEIVRGEQKWEAQEAFMLRKGCTTHQMGHGEFRWDCPEFPGSIECRRLWYYGEEESE